MHSGHTHRTRNPEQSSQGLPPGDAKRRGDEQVPRRHALLHGSRRKHQRGWDSSQLGGCVQGRDADAGTIQKPVPWWNSEIATLKRTCLRARGALQRSRRTDRAEARRTLKHAILDSKRECFLKLCDAAEHDPW